MTREMTDHQIVSKEAWTAARNEQLVLEKEHTRRGDELARLRHAAALGADRQGVHAPDRPRSPYPGRAFRGRSQLVIYSFMFGPDYEAGCPVCSSIADSFNGVLEHLKARDVTMICVSRAPLDKLITYRKRMGWNFEWASSYESDFNFDFERSVTTETIATRLGNEPPDMPHAGVTRPAAGR